MRLSERLSYIVFTAKQAEEILGVVRPPYVALFLYGSHARGDAGETSDVDVLQVTALHTAPYGVGRFNVTCYTLEQLLRLAGTGALFARHLVDEAVALHDPGDLLGALKSAYVAPQDYQVVRNQVAACAPLLDADESRFAENADGLSSLVGYLIRTYLYALAFDEGAHSFAMGHVVELLGQNGARGVLLDIRERTYETFARARRLFEQLTGVPCRRMEGSVEAFIVNASAHSGLATILGLRLLARGRPFTYDVLQGVEL